MVYWGIKVICVYQWWMDFKRGSWRNLIAPDIPFIWVPQRCTVIWERYIGGVAWRKSMQNLLLSVQIAKQVKVDHQRPGGLALNIKLLEWKWGMINMDFIIGLPNSRRQHDYIWVIVDKMTKSVHVLLVKTTYSTEDYATLYIQEVVRLHRVLVSIISDRGAQFTAQFWKSF